MPEINGQNLATVAHVTTLAQRVKSELDTLDGKSFSSLLVSGNSVSFYATADHTGTALATFDFPEELFLSQSGTELVENFSFSAATYPNATNPNLDGKTVLVLAVRGNAATPTVNYSFVDLAKLIKAISAGDNSININGYSISVKLSATSGNLLQLNNDGLFVGSDISKVDKVTGKQLSTEDFTSTEKTKLAGIAEGAQVNVIETIKVDNASVTPANKAVNIDLSGKVDKVTSATRGNVVIFGTGGALVDSGVSIESDANVAAAISSIFGSAS